MYFENCETIKIDDFYFEIPNSCKVDMSNCKTRMYEIRAFFEGNWEMKDYTNYTTYRKDMIKELKGFE